MTKENRQSIINNTKLPDSSSKLIFGDNILSSQFFRDYADMEILRNIRPEDIEDVSERYVPLYSTERESDTVKKVDISRYLPLEESKNRKEFYVENCLENICPIFSISLCGCGITAIRNFWKKGMRFLWQC